MRKRSPLFEGAAIAVLAAAVVGLFAGVERGVLPLKPARHEAVAEISWKDEAGRAGTVKLRESERYTARMLHEAFDRIGYDLAGVAGDGTPVPRLILAKLPRDLGSLRQVEVRKQVFLGMMLPIVLKVNEEIAADRQRLLALHHRSRLDIPLDEADREWLAQLAAEYGLERPDTKALLQRVDVIPPSLALAQAAEESGWGTSRFAQEGNALFGQWTFGGDGMVPRNAAVKGMGIRTFNTLTDAVRAYARNLNSHAAYAEFRRSREALRQSGGKLDGHRLAGTLLRYSERGEDYVRSVRSIIAANGLAALDDARLTREGVQQLADRSY